MNELGKVIVPDAKDTIIVLAPIITQTELYGLHDFSHRIELWINPQLHEFVDFASRVHEQE